MLVLRLGERLSDSHSQIQTAVRAPSRSQEQPPIRRQPKIKWCPEKLKQFKEIRNNQGLTREVCENVQSQSKAMDQVTPLNQLLIWKDSLSQVNLSNSKSQEFKLIQIQISLLFHHCKIPALASLISSNSKWWQISNLLTSLMRTTSLREACKTWNHSRGKLLS